MREIKFRAWDIKNKKMLTNIALYEGADHIGFSVQHAENIYGDAFKNGDIDFESGDGDWLYLLNGFHLMQSTGLKDKNGVEIYEGDIILEDDIFKHIIRYGKGTFDTGTYTYIGFYLEKNDEQSEHTWFTEQLDRFEVIGNIYENPELLENK